jgi:hypothetical protein
MLDSCADYWGNKSYFSHKFINQTVADILLFCRTITHGSTHKIMHLNNKQEDDFCLYDNLHTIFKPEQAPFPIKLKYSTLLSPFNKPNVLYMHVVNIVS